MYEDWEDKGGKKSLGQQYSSHTEFTASNDWWLHACWRYKTSQINNELFFLISGVHVSYICDSWLFIYCILQNKIIEKFMFWTVLILRKQ